MKKEGRKIYSSGKSSYILTLPKSWVTSNGLKSGDMVLMDIGKDDIKISAKNSEKGKKEGILDFKRASGESLMRRIISHYLAGYDSLTVRTYNDEQRSAINKCSEILIGLEVIEDVGREVQIEIFLDFQRLKTTDIIEKLSRICQSMFSDFCEAFREYDEFICNSIISREKEVDKLHFLVLRQLKVAIEYTDVNDTLGVGKEVLEYRTVVRGLERVADHGANIAESLIKLKKPIPNLCGLTNLSLDLLKTSIVSFFKREPEFAEEVLDKYDLLLEEEKKHYEFILDMEIEEALLVKTILDSLYRICGYSADIAEAAINLSV